MIKNTTLLALEVTYCLSADVYDISADEYKKYIQNPTEMTKIFENKFLKKEQQPQQIKIIENNTSSKVIEEKQNYDLISNKVIGKLRYATLRQEKSIELLVSDIDFLLKFKNVSYNTDEVSLVVRQINSGKLSPFEANIYLQQLIKLIKD